MERKLRKFLKSTYGCESDSPEIQEKLKSIVGDELQKEKIAEKLYYWVRDNIKYELVQLIGAKGLLTRKTGACVDKTSLYIALCRAAEIPARYVIISVKLNTTKSISLTELNHCAPEIYINDDWKIVDPTFDPSLISLFPQATFDSINWWDIENSEINYKTKEIDKNLSDVVSESYEKHELNIEFKEIIKKERS